MIIDKFFISKKEANYLLGQIDDEYLDMEGVEYISVRRRWLFPYFYYIEFGVSKTHKHSDEKIILNNDDGTLVIPRSFQFDVNKINDFDAKPKSKTLRTQVKMTASAKRIPPLEDPTMKPPWSISHDLLPSGGTLGGVVTLSNPGLEDGLYGISNWHVVQTTNESYGQNIFIPKTTGFTIEQKQQAYFGYSSWAKMDSYTDVGLFKIENEDKIPKQRGCNPTFKGITSPVIGKKAFKCGISSGLTSATIVSENTSVWVEVGGERRKFKQQIQIKKLSESGDSGSLLFNRRKEVIGLLFASDKHAENSFSYANNINYIFNRPFPEQEFYLKSGSVGVSQLNFNSFIN